MLRIYLQWWSHKKDLQKQNIWQMWYFLGPRHISTLKTNTLKRQNKKLTILRKVIRLFLPTMWLNQNIALSFVFDLKVVCTCDDKGLLSKIFVLFSDEDLAPLCFFTAGVSRLQWNTSYLLCFVFFFSIENGFIIIFVLGMLTKQ